MLSSDDSNETCSMDINSPVERPLQMRDYQLMKRSANFTCVNFANLAHAGGVQVSRVVITL